ncbi:hypothetical protein J6590_101065 [Homalodisca vitripennis]|nr:hypothetical protein J6590_101065 [Homalodisca vitripennis]
MKSQQTGESNPSDATAQGPREQSVNTSHLHQRRRDTDQCPPTRVWNNLNTCIPHRTKTQQYSKRHESANFISLQSHLAFRLLKLRLIREHRLDYC